MEIPKFDTKNELLEFLSKNKETLIAQKKMETKFSDGFGYFPVLNVRKSNNATEKPSDVINVKAIINTTNVLDSHDDVHIPGLWDKSLRENKNIMHLQEHQMKFDSIISDGNDLKTSAKTMTWKEIGFDFKGNTEALVFDSKVRKSRNPFMHKQYAGGIVKNHSVGMRYVKLSLAINDEESGANFDVWEKYIDQVANKEQAEDQGYFWAVKEAKIIEGSAVPIGSNQFTPTLENKSGPVQTTHNEPRESTHINEFKKILKESL